MASIETREVRVAGVRSLVRTSGPQTAREAVVFLHGNPGSSEDWVELLGRVGDFARAIAPDMPGFGKAARPRDFAYDIPGYARHLAGLLERLGVERAHLVLHDFGGPWGLWWASLDPRAVASLTLIDVGFMPGYTWHTAARIWQTPLLGELFQLLTTRGGFRAVLDRQNPRPLPRAFLDRMSEDYDRGTKRAVLALYRSARNLAPLNDAVATRLREHHLPTLVVWGKDDPYLPCHYAERQREVFLVQGVHVLDGCGHWPFIDAPERVAEVVVPFLRRQVSREASTTAS